MNLDCNQTKAVVVKIAAACQLSTAALNGATVIVVVIWFPTNIHLYMHSHTESLSHNFFIENLKFHMRFV